MQFIGLAGKAGAGKDSVADILVRDHGFLKFSFSDPLYKEVSEAFDVPLADLYDREQKERPHAKLTAGNCRDDAFRELMMHMLEGPWANRPAFTYGEALREEWSPRVVLQVWGTEYRREQNPDYWVEKAAMWVEAFLRTLERTPQPGDPDYDHYRARLSMPQEPVMQAHPGIVNSSARFPNEQKWIRGCQGQIWHIRRPITTADAQASAHTSDANIPDPQTGDKIIVNNGDLATLATGVSLALQGNDIVNITGAKWL